jgi:altered-inheritance-of-mitochondria protein 5
MRAQFSGFALTSTVLYLTIQAHRANRLEQSHTIREQLRSLNWIASPIGAYDRRLTPKDQPQVDPEKSRLQL